MTQAPNRDVSLTVTHPTVRQPGDVPMNPLTELKGWKVSHTVGGSNTYDVVNPLVPITQNTLVMTNYPPGVHNFKIEWIDLYDQVSGPAMASVSIAFPGVPDHGAVTDIHLV